jgi:hypothetical protein
MANQGAFKRAGPDAQSVPGALVHARIESFVMSTTARYYIAAITGCPASTVQKALRQPKWQSYLAKNPGPCPLDVPMTATIDDQPWLQGIDHFQVGSLVAYLNTACFIVIAYLTGMRSSEVLALHAGCCPEPPSADDSDRAATRRHLIRARHYKTAYDEDGNHLSEGALRPAPWVAVPQVVAAIRILEQQAAPTGLLFPTNDASRPGRSVTYATMCRRIDDFVTWVNDRAGEAIIPPDPHGRIGTRRFRRTLAWHIARQPGGLVALAVQYGHMRTLISEGYAARQRDGIHELLDLETARAVADHLADVHDSLQVGHGVSGPAARRLIHAARQQHQRFAGAILTRRQAKALLADPTLTVFDNASAYLNATTTRPKLCAIPTTSRRTDRVHPAWTAANPPAPTSPAPTATPPSCGSKPNTRSDKQIHPPHQDRSPNVCATAR